VHRSLAVSALVSWVLAELLGAYMARNWVRSGAARRRRTQPDAMSLPVLIGHASLNLAGLSCWIAFVATRSAAAAWIGLGFLIPAIGLGVSTVSVWTPYPVARAHGDQPGPASDLRTSAIQDQLLARSLDDEALSRQVVEELLARNLALEAAEPPQRVRLDPRALVPLAHGILAIATFLLATLGAVSAS
jgi:hypothetical protein